MLGLYCLKWVTTLYHPQTHEHILRHAHGLQQHTHCHMHTDKANTHTHTHTYMHTYVYTYTHTHTHTHTHPDFNNADKKPAAVFVYLSSHDDTSSLVTATKP